MRLSATNDPYLRIKGGYTGKFDIRRSKPESTASYVREARTSIEWTVSSVLLTVKYYTAIVEILFVIPDP